MYRWLTEECSLPVLQFLFDWLQLTYTPFMDGTVVLEILCTTVNEAVQSVFAYSFLLWR